MRNFLSILPSRREEHLLLIEIPSNLRTLPAYINKHVHMHVEGHLIPHQQQIFGSVEGPDVTSTGITA